MVADNEGFLYPQVDTTVCINCGLCEKVCPVINQNEPREPLAVYAAKINNDEIAPLLDSAKTRIESEKTEKARIELEKEKLQEEKQLKKAQREIENQKKALEVKKPRTRAIIQMNDDGSIVNEFISISEAVSETGINSKSIRDAANGVQKHAGGFCWKYIE